MHTGVVPRGAQHGACDQARVLSAGVGRRQEAQRSLALTKKDVKLCGRELADHLAATEASLTTTLARVRLRSRVSWVTLVWWALYSWALAKD